MYVFIFPEQIDLYVLTQTVNAKEYVYLNSVIID